MRIVLMTVLFVALGLIGNAQNSKVDALSYASQISLDSLKHHLEIVASDEFEGRETGRKGQKMAAEYIANEIERYGLEAVGDSGYYQRFNVLESGISEAYFKLDSDSLAFLDDFYSFGAMLQNGERKIDNLHFLGYGVDDSLYSDYAELKENPENIVIWEEEPQDRDGNYLLTGSGLNTEWSKDFSIKVAAAKRRGVKNLFIVKEDYKTMVKRIGFYLSSPRVSLVKEDSKEPDLAVYYISEKTAKHMLGKSYKPIKIKHKIARKKRGFPFQVDINLSIHVDKDSKIVSTENVVGLLPGKSKKEEYLVVTAHYDHLGIRGEEIYNGADDDGSGTVGVLEMARVFSKAKADGNGPERSILFLWVSGEEKGLLGSQYYVENPLIPLENTVANLNIDMIGRSDENHEPNTDYVYLIGSDRLSTTLHAISEETNQECCNIDLDYTYNNPNDPNRFYYRSDHYNFIRNGIPAIFYFSGVHEDYHQPGDTVDKIQFGKMTNIVRLIFGTAWNITNTDKSITVDVVDDEEN